MVFNTGAALLDAIVLAVVSREAEGTYGYKITQDVRGAIDVSESTLYPVLRRLQKDHALFLSKLYIHEQFRGYHLATEALKFLVALCKTRGLNRIWLTCNKHNDTTLAIYDHLGFRIVDEQVADIGNGFVMDDYILMYEI